LGPAGIQQLSFPQFPEPKQLGWVLAKGTRKHWNPGKESLGPFGL